MGLTKAKAKHQFGKSHGCLLQNEIDTDCDGHEEQSNETKVAESRAVAVLWDASAVSKEVDNSRYNPDLTGCGTVRQNRGRKPKGKQQRKIRISKETEAG